MKHVIVAAVSGGPDSVYLLRKLSSKKGIRIVVGHVNYGTRGIDSSNDKHFVDKICKNYGYETVFLEIKRRSNETDSKRAPGARGHFPAGFERKAREIRYRFLKELSVKEGASAIALAHTADDQVETILMRVFEGAGIAGLKGIPRDTADGIVRPILDVWKEDILKYLKKRKIPYRIDRSNEDVRFERNWVRNVLLPLLEKRYDKGVKKRIFTLGERFRELDDYLESEAGRWIRRNVRKSPGRTRPESQVGYAFRRKTFSALPAALRMKILQRICFDRLGIAPNERLLASMDGIVSTGGPSGRVSAGKGWTLANRYEEARFEPIREKGAGIEIVLEERDKVTPSQARRLSAKGDAEVFDAAALALPLSVRPLRTGDRIRPFGGSAAGNTREGGRKVKEILIDRKVPREERWGRPVVCDAEGAILWIPGVLRSAHAPVGERTRKAAILRVRSVN